MTNPVDDVQIVRVCASAKVELIQRGVVSMWEVEVWGEDPHDHRRTYQIKSRSDNDAAFEGIRQFVEEMENLGDQKED
jgi:hypothetical protein